MKIVRIIARLNVGGPARHVVWLTRELHGDDFQSVLLAGTVPEGEEDMGWFAVANEVEPVFIPEMSRELSLKDIVSIWKVYRRILREKPEVIHTHTAKAGTVGRIAGLLYRWLSWQTLTGKPRRVRFVHTFHGHVFHSYYGKRKTQIFLLVEKILARIATDKIIVITDQQFEEIHRQFGIGKSKQFEIIPLGIDLKTFESSPEKRKILRDELGASETEILVGFVGRLTEIKNIPLFLKVAKIYLEQKEAGLPRLKFVIIGDGHLRQSLESEAETLGLKDSVKFLGNRNDADVFYAGLDIVALVSLNEGTPLSLIEAMASGKPVISTRVGGVVDLIGAAQVEKKGFTICERGVGIESNDADGFYNGLIHLANDEKLRAELAKRGKKFATERYGKERLFEDIKRLYRNLTAN